MTIRLKLVLKDGRVVELSSCEEGASRQIDVDSVAIEETLVAMLREAPFDRIYTVAGEITKAEFVKMVMERDVHVEPYIETFKRVLRDCLRR